MSSAPLIGLFASGVWLDLGSPPNVSAATISGYVTEPSTLGRLNSYIGTCYSGSGFAGNTGIGAYDYDVVPDLTNTELSLIQQMYLVGYYNSLSQATMGAGGTTTPWQALAEGDSRITRANIPGIGNVYAGMAKEAKQQLNYLINVYINNAQGGNVPRSVTFYNLAYPEWGSSYNGWGP